MVEIEALVFRDDIREESPLVIHDNNFLHLNKGYFHVETGEGSIIKFGEEKPYQFSDITSVIDEKTSELVEKFLEEGLLDIEQIGIVIDENCSSNILMYYENGIDFSEYIHDEYAEYYDNKKHKTTGYIFINSEDAYIFEKVQEIQERFSKDNGLNINFIYEEGNEDKVKQLAEIVEDFLINEGY